jgi:putative nucleotidyltransferase with HDIG domain
MSLTGWGFELAREHLAQPRPRRWRHVRSVAGRAVQAAAVVAGEDADLLVVAGVLHDIGYAPELAWTGFHPLDGARYLRSLDAPPRLVNLVAHHSCAYRQAQLLGWAAELATEFIDEGPTPVRDALWWADQTTGPDGQQMTVQQRLAEVQQRHGPGSVSTRAILHGRPERIAAVERTRARLHAVGMADPATHEHEIGTAPGAAGPAT